MNTLNFSSLFKKQGKTNFLKAIWIKKPNGETVYPYVVNSKKSGLSGLSVSMTGESSKYICITFEEFIKLLKNGKFEDRGCIRMKSLKGDNNGGFSIKKASISDEIKTMLSN